ncbi:MAG: WhiB family transcriptional regulator [Aeromicrobium erythreum]
MASISRLPLPIQESYEWQYRGACRTTEPETFFSPESERGPRRRAREARAKALCDVCPVKRECLEHALAVQEPYGVWGGLNATERGHLLAARRNAAS